MLDVAAPVVDISATLPHPVGVNRVWRSGQGRTYKAADAIAWQQASAAILLEAGLRRLAPGPWAVSVFYALFTCRLDIDAPAKLLLDTICMGAPIGHRVTVGGLGIDDGCVTELLAVRHRVRHYSDQRLEVLIRVNPGVE